MSSSNPYDSRQLEDFEKKRKRLLKSKSGIEDNNRRVRLLGFERAMKEQFGPNVVVDPSGQASRGGQVVGNIDDYIKAGGSLRGTPRDTRSKLAIQKEKEEEFNKNFDFEKAMSALDTGSTPRLDASTFAPTPSNKNEVDFAEMDKVMAEPESLNDILEKSLTGTDRGNATGTGLQDQLNQTNARLDQLKILQDASVADVAADIKANPSRIQTGLMESGFTPERLAKLRIKNAKFQLKKRGK
tara:strand:+ start:126 stop:851 length:726 start_codon:yes stop_codon:yes gene_type:complete